MTKAEERAKVEARILALDAEIVKEYIASDRAAAYGDFDHAAECMESASQLREQRELLERSLIGQ